MSEATKLLDRLGTIETNLNDFKKSREGELKAAEKGAEKFAGEGRRVFTRRPPEQYDDWNSALPDWRKRGEAPWET